MGFLSNLFNRDRSKDTAKKRLKMVLMHDRSDIAPEVMQAMQRDILAVIAKYMDVEVGGTVCRVSSEDDVAALEISVPVRGMKRGTSVLSDLADRNN